MNQKLLIGLLVTGIIIKNAVQGIIIPIIVQFYDSLNFILLSTSLQFIIIFGVFYLILTKGTFYLPPKKMLVFMTGLFNAFMALTLIYSANPARTPIIIQIILAGLPIIPSCFLRKYLLDKLIIYNKKYVTLSLIFILLSLGFAAIPLTSDWHPDSIVWIGFFTIGIIFQSTYNVLQEKYIFETNDDSLLNKMTLIFYTRVVEFIVLICFFWLEYLLGYTNDPYAAFFDSILQFAMNIKAALLLEGFVLAYIGSYTLGTYLNSISSNYNMLTPLVSNPAVAVFFTVFSGFNNGIKYPLWVILCCMTFSVTGIIFWIIGEKNTGYVSLGIQS
jgi:hypothetical protein